MPAIYTPRLFLREFLPEDWHTLNRFLSDPAVTRYMHFRNYDERMRRSWFESCLTEDKVLSRDVYNWALALRGNNRLIGWLGIGGTPDERGFGYVLDRHYWNQGYATEAVRALFAYEFFHLGTKRLTATCEVPNTASARVMEKAGMRYEETAYHSDHEGNWARRHRFGISDDGFYDLNSTWANELVTRASPSAEPHRIRSAAPNEAAAIAAVHNTSWRAAYQGLVPQEYLDGLDLGRRRAVWKSILRNAEWPYEGTLVAEVNEEIVGFLGFCHGRDNDEDPSLVGEVASLYLLPSVWGRGIGQDLLEASVNALANAGFRQCTLWVLDGNHRARRFYETNGFRPDGTTKRDESRGFPLTEVRYRRALP